MSGSFAVTTVQPVQNETKPDLTMSTVDGYKILKKRLKIVRSM